MGLIVEKFIDCDFKISSDCSETFGADNRYGYKNVKLIRDEAKINNWLFVKGKDCCPNCAKESTKQLIIGETCQK
uniref:Uncharacterized protein n=2 Tax=viral metagenome TaxID=1070528 RepID=A0A6H1ZLL3_9ZZZZ